MTEGQATAPNAWPLRHCHDQGLRVELQITVIVCASSRSPKRRPALRVEIAFWHHSSRWILYSAFTIWLTKSLRSRSYERSWAHRASDMSVWQACCVPARLRSSRMGRAALNRQSDPNRCPRGTGPSSSDLHRYSRTTEIAVSSEPGCPSGTNLPRSQIPGGLS